MFRDEKLGLQRKIEKFKKGTGLSDEDVKTIAESKGYKELLTPEGLHWYKKNGIENDCGLTIDVFAREEKTLYLQNVTEEENIALFNKAKKKLGFSSQEMVTILEGAASYSTEVLEELSVDEGSVKYFKNDLNKSGLTRGEVASALKGVADEVDCIGGAKGISTLFYRLDDLAKFQEQTGFSPRDTATAINGAGIYMYEVMEAIFDKDNIARIQALQKDAGLTTSEIASKLEGEGMNITEKLLTLSIDLLPIGVVPKKNDEEASKDVLPEKNGEEASNVISFLDKAKASKKDREIDR